MFDAAGEVKVTTYECLLTKRGQSCVDYFLVSSESPPTRKKTQERADLRPRDARLCRAIGPYEGEYQVSGREVNMVKVDEKETERLRGSRKVQLMTSKVGTGVIGRMIQ